MRQEYTIIMSRNLNSSPNDGSARAVAALLRVAPFLKVHGLHLRPGDGDDGGDGDMMVVVVI